MTASPVAALVAHIRAEILPTWGIDAFRDDPGGLIAYHADADHTPDDDIAAAATAAILDTHPDPAPPTADRTPAMPELTVTAADTTDYRPADTTAPTVARIWTIPATANTTEQTGVLFTDGTRITVADDGRVKAGRDWHRIDRDDVTIRNYGPGKGPKGSPASGFLTLYLTPRDDAPAVAR